MSTLLPNPFRWAFGLLVVASACVLTVANVRSASSPDAKTRPGDPGDSSAVTLQMIPPKDATPEVARSVEKEFPDGDVHALQMLDDQVVLAFVETFPGKWSGLYLADLKTHKKSDAIAPIGEVIGTAKDLGGNVWTIIKGESEAQGYIEHNYSAVRIHRIGDHSYESARIWLASYAGEFESEANLCEYFKAGESVDVDATLLILLS